MDEIWTVEINGVVYLHEANPFEYKISKIIYDDNGIKHGLELYKVIR